MEAGFLVLQYRLFGFDVPSMIKCGKFPCPNVVDCFISRPMEKTIFLRFMYILSIICVVMNVVEFHYMLYRIIWVSFKQSRYRRSTCGQLEKANDHNRMFDSAIPHKKQKLSQSKKKVATTPSGVNTTKATTPNEMQHMEEMAMKHVGSIKDR